MKRALITGANGQDAFFLTKLLLSKNYKVKLTTRYKNNSHLKYLSKVFNKGRSESCNEDRKCKGFEVGIF